MGENLEYFKPRVLRILLYSLSLYVYIYTLVLVIARFLRLWGARGCTRFCEVSKTMGCTWYACGGLNINWREKIHQTTYNTIQLYRQVSIELH